MALPGFKAPGKAWTAVLMLRCHACNYNPRTYVSQAAQQISTFGSFGRCNSTFPRSSMLAQTTKACHFRRRCCSGEWSRTDMGTLSTPTAIYQHCLARSASLLGRNRCYLVVASSPDLCDHRVLCAESSKTKHTATPRGRVEGGSSTDVVPDSNASLSHCAFDDWRAMAQRLRWPP